MTDKAAARSAPARRAAERRAKMNAIKSGAPLAGPSSEQAGASSSVVTPPAGSVLSPAPTPPPQSQESTMAAKKEKKPKKEKPQTPAKVAEGRSNLSDDSIRDLLAEANLLDADIKLAASELRERSGRFRAHMKLCKKSGLKPTNVRWWLDTKIREIEDVNTEIVERNRIARIMELPIGKQLGLFDDGVTVATAIDEDKIQLGESGGAGETDTLAVAYHLGHEAGMAGKTYAECKYTEDTPHWSEWMKAWDDAQFELGSRIQPTEPANDELDSGDALDHASAATTDEEVETDDDGNPLPF